MAAFQGFSQQTFQFLHDLAFNNSRDWFEAHRPVYERAIIEPALALITAMDPVIQAISPHYRGVAKRVGGSLMRIYRDTRFGKDKTPYKTNIGIQFRHVLAGDVHAPGYYLHLAVDECFLGVGTWRPEAPDLLRIRRRMADYSDDYLRAVAQSTTGGLSLTGESLKKVPRGFDPGHPLAEELKRIDFLLSTNLPPDLYLSEKLLTELSQKFQAATPYMRFLCQALEVNF